MDLIRSFIAFTVPRQIIETAYDIQTELKKLNIKKINYVRPENIHMTILFLGNKPQEELKNIIKNISQIKEAKAKIKFTDSYVGYFGRKNNPSVLFMGFKDEGKFAQTLVLDICSSISIKPDKPWHPHLTLARFNGKNSNWDAESVRKIRVQQTTFSPEKIVLFSSKLAPSGPAYETMYIFE